MMRVKLNLTDAELMNKSWISVNLEMADFPYYDYKSDKNGPNHVISDKDEARESLSKHVKK